MTDADLICYSIQLLILFIDFHGSILFFLVGGVKWCFDLPSAGDEVIKSDFSS